MQRAAVLAQQQSAGTNKAAQTKPSGPVIVVFGSCFLDYIGYVESIPKPGETLASQSFAKGFGGKGANQAVMAARLGGNVRMVASVGDDGDGADYIANFERENVDVRFMKRVPQTATGLAMIAVSTANAENSIVICPNAAGRTRAEDFTEVPQILEGAKVLILQNEIPLEASLKALKHAHEKGIYTVFNTAPAPSAKDIEQLKPFLRYVSMLCPNEHEAALMTGIDVKDFESAVAAARRIQSLGVRDVVITLGKQGACVVTSDKATHVPGVKVKAVDTTGAGDSFVGSLAYFAANGDSLEKAARKANVCAAQSVTRRGTQSSYPRKHELPKDLFES